MKLHVYVSRHCASCGRSVALGKAVAAHFDDLVLEVVDMDDPLITKADIVFAVPTFLLDEQLLCLGNQDEEWLVKRVQKMREQGKSRN